MRIKIEFDNGYVEFGSDQQLSDKDESELMEEVRGLIGGLLEYNGINCWSEIGD